MLAITRAKVDPQPTIPDVLTSIADGQTCYRFTITLSNRYL